VELGGEGNPLHAKTTAIILFSSIAAGYEFGIRLAFRYFG
jgi:hypothetical protein